MNNKTKEFSQSVSAVPVPFTWSDGIWTNTSNRVAHLLEMRGISVDNGIWIETTLFSSAKEFLACLKEICDSGCYIEGIDISTIAGLLREKPQKYSSLGNILIGRDIVPFPPEYTSFEGRIRIDKIIGTATFEFGPFYITLDQNGNELPEDQIHSGRLSRDIFLALLMRRGIFAGFDIENISMLIDKDHRTPSFEMVARNIPPTNGANASIDLTDLHIVRKGVREVKGKGDLRLQEMPFPRAKDGDILAKKKRATSGIDGMTILGEIITSEDWKEEDISIKMGNGTKIVLNDVTDEDFLVATTVGYINVVPTTGQISINPTKDNTDAIGQMTGSITVPSGTSFVQRGDVIAGYHLLGDISFALPKDSRGQESTNGNITILGSVMKTTEWDLVIPWEIYAIRGGVKVTSGDLTVRDAIRQTKRIMALHGKVTVPFIENTIVIADEVEVSGSINNSTIIARKVSAGSCTGSRICASDVAIQTRTTPYHDNDSVIMPVIYSIKKEEESVSNLETLLTKTKEDKRYAIREQRNIQESDDGKIFLALRNKAQNKAITEVEIESFKQLGATILPKLRALSISIEWLKADMIRLNSEISALRIKIEAVENSPNRLISVQLGDRTGTNGVMVLGLHTNLIPYSFWAIAALDLQEQERIIQLILSALRDPNKIDFWSTRKIDLDKIGIRTFSNDDFSLVSDVPTENRGHFEGDDFEHTVIEAAVIEKQFWSKIQFCEDGNRHYVPVRIDEQSNGWLMGIGAEACSFALSKHHDELPSYYEGNECRLSLNSEVYMCRITKVFSQPNSIIIHCRFIFQNFPEQKRILDLKNTIERNQNTGRDLTKQPYFHS